MQKNPKILSSSPRATSPGPLATEDIERAERTLPVRLPELVRLWVTQLGVVDIERPVEGRPHLLLLGLSSGSTIDDNIVAFNRPNPTLPQGYLVFAHEFDGMIDHVYAVAPSGTVLRSSGFLFPSLEYTDEYANSRWEEAFTDLDAFWDTKVQFYLEQ